jgi:hypothetical protein
MHFWRNEKDFIGMIPENISKQDVSLEDAENIILQKRFPLKHEKYKVHRLRG